MVEVCTAKTLTDTDADGYTPLHRAMAKQKGASEFGELGPSLPSWDDHFNPIHVLEEIKQRHYADEILPQILTTTNKQGDSPYQENLEKYELKTPGFESSFKNLIYNKVKRISNLRLDMSDFNQSSYNFEEFDDDILQFEDTLSVHLPDLNYVKQPCPHTALETLFNWLKDKKLNIPDSTTNPMNPAFSELKALNKFKIKFTNVRIKIIHFDHANGGHCKEVVDRYRERAKEYRAALESRHSKNKKLYENKPNTNFKYKSEVKTEAKWYYPPPSHQVEEPTARIPIREEMPDPEVDKYMDQRRKLQMYSLSPRSLLSGQPDKRIKVAIIDNGADKIRASVGEMIAKGISYVTADRFGSDRILPWWMVSDSHGTHMASLIGQINPYCRLYIARVGKGRNDIDPKIGAKAVRWALEQKVDIISISWTTRTEDKELSKAIADATGESARRRTLIFCSTSDEGLYSDGIWPVDYDDVVSVSATDRWGRLTPKTQGRRTVDIQIPGENIEALGASYIGTARPTVSGSSVATALAAGIASLALLLLRTYNDLNEEQTRKFYTREGILRIFNKMDANKGGIQLSKLFPRDTRDVDVTHQTLATHWKFANFPSSERA
ncbi:subtilisin-like protein [Xylaria castorea]|nr:subtilisin-like protein [Xylaria castorea]